MAVTSPEQPFTLNQIAPQPPRRRRGLIVGLAVGAVVLVAATAAITAALVGGHNPARKPAAAAAPSTAATVTSAPNPAPSSTATAPSAPSTTAHKLGETVLEAGGIGKSTVYAFKQPVAKNAPRPDQAGYEWAAADVEVCALVDGLYVNTLPWHLVYADHTTIDVSSTGYNQFPEPGYPAGDRDLPKDRCIRGWITFGAPADKRPIAVQHSPAGILTEWAIA